MAYVNKDRIVIEKSVENAILRRPGCKIPEKKLVNPNETKAHKIGLIIALDTFRKEIEHKYLFIKKTDVIERMTLTQMLQKYAKSTLVCPLKRRKTIKGFKVNKKPFIKLLSLTFPVA